MSSSLLMTRRFAPLFWTQFFSAFSDTFLKQALVLLILFKIGGAAAEPLITLAAAFLNAVFGFSLYTLGYDRASLYTLYVALFLFGASPSQFGPIKYGILPDPLKR